jgi:hypothetical protein
MNKYARTLYAVKTYCSLTGTKWVQFVFCLFVAIEFGDKMNQRRQKLTLFSLESQDLRQNQINSQH